MEGRGADPRELEELDRRGLGVGPEEVVQLVEAG